MVTRALVALAVLAGGCSNSPGVHYILRVEPSPQALAQADRLEIDLFRLGTSESKHFGVNLGVPSPAPPWILDLQSDSWGSLPIEVQALATNGGQPVAMGTGGPVASVIDIRLVDFFPMQGPIDLATPFPPFDEGGNPMDLATDDAATDGGTTD